MRALRLIADRKLELAEVPAPPPPGGGEVQVRIKAVALNHLDVWGFRGMAFAKRQAAAGGRRGGLRRDRRRWAPASPAFKPGDKVVMYGAMTCGHCAACREGRDNLCENVGGIMGFHIDGFARDLINLPARLVDPGAGGRVAARCGLRADRLRHRRAHAVRQRQAQAGRNHSGARRRLRHRLGRHQDGEGDRLHRHHHRRRRRQGGKGQGARAPTTSSTTRPSASRASPASSPPRRASTWCSSTSAAKASTLRYSASSAAAGW